MNKTGSVPATCKKGKVSLVGHSCMWLWTAETYWFTGIELRGKC